MVLSRSSCDPPFEERYRDLFSVPAKARDISRGRVRREIAECELPLIDLDGLRGAERGACVAAIAKASSEWGSFQVLNHGISRELLGAMRREQEAIFKTPFEKKASSGLWNGSYRDVMSELARPMSELARTLAEVLAENLGYLGSRGFTEGCSKSTCFLRLNRYPPCPYSPETFGLMPHTDSDFLTILYQDQVGGLQLMKDSRWVAVKPNPDALIVNIGDLFQAWSNDVYKSVEHKVMVNGEVERYSMAYFLCPSYESIIGSCREASIYKSFTFGQFRQQVQDDLKRTGYKVGLSRFLL